MKKSKETRKGKRRRSGGRATPPRDVKPTPLDDIRQWFQPPEWRIDPPVFESPLGPTVVSPPEPTSPPSVPPSLPPGPELKPDVPRFGVAPALSDQVLAGLATCLWYLKTKHFKREWHDQSGSDDDPRVRRALGRLSKGIDALRSGGVHVEDPTNRRYPTGGEAMMRPLQFTPTVGLTYEKVTETVSPIVYRDDRLIQRAEVFVAVPADDASAMTTGAPSQHGTNLHPGGDGQADTQRSARDGGEQSVTRNSQTQQATSRVRVQSGQEKKE